MLDITQAPGDQTMLISTEQTQHEGYQNKLNVTEHLDQTVLNDNNRTSVNETKEDPNQTLLPGIQNSVNYSGKDQVDSDESIDQTMVMHKVNHVISNRFSLNIEDENDTTQIENGKSVLLQ